MKNLHGRGPTDILVGPFRKFRGRIGTILTEDTVLMPVYEPDYQSLTSSGFLDDSPKTAFETGSCASEPPPQLETPSTSGIILPTPC